MQNINKFKIDGGRVDGKVISNFYSENFLKAWCFGEEIFLDYKPEEDTYVAYSCNEDNLCRI